MANLKNLKPEGNKENKEKKSKYDVRLQYNVGETESFKNLRKMFQTNN